ncbi:MAG: L,D-transpeptidase family protein [Candidatus Omnitrophota bacterium]
MKKYRFAIIAVAVAVVLVFAVLRIKRIFSSIRQENSEAAQFSEPAESFEQMLKKAGELAAQGELLVAEEAYRNIIIAYASRPGIEDIQKKLQDINMCILFSAIQVPDQTTTRTVKSGDSLSMIADEFHTTAEFIKKQNGLKNDIIRVGMPLRIWTGRFNVVVDKSQNILTLNSNTEVVRTYRVATGKNNITPVGNFKIVNKLKEPSWTHDGKLIPAGSPENILGTRWLGFDIPGYGIHGTTDPQSIGQQATAGCVRMRNNEVEELYDLLPVGTEVAVMD